MSNTCDTTCNDILALLHLAQHTFVHPGIPHTYVLSDNYTNPSVSSLLLPSAIPYHFLSWSYIHIHINCLVTIIDTYNITFLLANIMSPLLIIDVSFRINLGYAFSHFVSFSASISYSFWHVLWPCGNVIHIPLYYTLYCTTISTSAIPILHPPSHLVYISIFVLTIYINISWSFVVKCPQLTHYPVPNVLFR